MKYIVRGSKVMATVETGTPCPLSLASRGEVLIEQEEVVELPADFINDKVVPHVDTAEEKATKETIRKAQIRHDLIHEEADRLAEESLKKKGLDLNAEVEKRAKE